jgi:hypothetical protein
MKIPKHKPIAPIVFMLMFLAVPFQMAMAQNYNVDGATATCEGEPYYYRADPAGGTLKVWAVFGGTIVSGTIHSEEIVVVWSAGSNELSWIASHVTGGGDGGHKSVTTYPKVAPALSADCNLGSNLVNAVASAPAGATSWEWTFTGFGYSSAYTTTTSSPSLNLYVPNASIPGTICVRAYFTVCGEYGPSTCNSYP